MKNFGTHTGVLVPIASLALLEVRQISLLSGTPVGLKKCFKIHGNRNQISYKQHLAKYTKFNFCHNFKVKSGKDGKGLKLENTAFKFGCDLNSKKFQKFNMYHKIHVILSFGFSGILLLLNQVKSFIFRPAMTYEQQNYCKGAPIMKNGNNENHMCKQASI